MTTVERIHVTENERQIFDLLLRAVGNFSPETKLRVAGGQNSSDIDIAISNMLPSAFLAELNKYLRSQGEDEVQGHVIESKPAQQGKQKPTLETVKMSLYNHSIDLVNLRRDVYERGSRIPVKVVFASPEEDAFRRDLTINSLFYNIHTGLVEDLTGRGMDDLKAGRIATPLHARDTFLEDPLRVLRAIRFAARFGFPLDEQLKEAASSEEVRAALAGEVSRERIGNEIDLMISGNRPVSALHLLSDLKLLGLVFALPASSEPNCVSLSLCRAYVEAMWNLIHTPGLVNLSGEQIRHALYAALLLPFRKMVYKEKTRKSSAAPLVNYMLKVSMKRKSSDAETVVNIHRATGRFLSLKNGVVQVDKREWGATDVFEHLESICQDDPEVPATSKTRVLAGFLLKDIRDLWPVAALLTSLLLSTDEVNQREIYLRIAGTIREMCLDTIWDEKPLVDASDIIKALQLTNRGPIIREWQQRLLAWQLAYPKGMPMAKRSKAPM
ncbi:unnamed protein product [Microthlaspi erraticum]|uniref:Poly A polymerase head domain-containing protein n=1 Tax=Microthlaspi erraticum TaxID=1685480 RepID=A0A6D2I2Z2_9BRAS|nr:unnamed protein product [Microthlaspi erraticum]